jgi:hypothetical protein
MRIVDRTFRFIAGAVFAASVLAAVGTSAANAQQTQPPTVKAFLANPGQLLQQYPNGGLLLIKAVQQLALADPSTFGPLLALLTSGNDLQRGAIGDGLAQAAKIEVLADQTLAADWQTQIAAITDPAFKTAATDAFGDVVIGAVGGTALGGALGGFGGGPQVSTNTGTTEDIQSTPTKTQSFVFTQTTIFRTSAPSRSVSP